MFAHVRTHQALSVGVLAGLIAGVCGGFHASPYNNYVLLANAFLHGRVWIPQPSPAIDALPYKSMYYIIEAPLPAVLLLPFVARYGLETNQSLLGVALCAVAVGATWNLMQHMRVAFVSRIFVALMLFAGTDLFWCASLGDVWFLAHVASVAMSMLALREACVGRRPWLVAFWACAAVEARFSMLLALPVYFAMLVWQPSFTTLRSTLAASDFKRRLLEMGLPFFGVVAAFVAAWVAYNELRWGLPVDIGYTNWYHQDSAGSPVGSPFGLRYLAYEMQSFFAAFPPFQATFPYVQSPISGLALEVTSPGLLLAFFARGDRKLILALWCATVLTAVPSFLYYVDGFAQFGMRHALDFEPFLIVLIAAALRSRTRIWQAVPCVYSAFVGCWGVWYWHAVMGR